MLRCLLKAGIECESFKSVSSQFLAWGAATENTLLSVFHLVLWMTKLPLLDEHKNEHKGTSDAGVNKFVR